MTDDIESTIKQAETGIEAEVFLRSRLGLYLTERADAERTELLTKLIEADPSDEKTNRIIRLELGSIDRFFTWITEAINSGHLAQSHIEQHDAESSDH